ncbi:pyridoxal-phosphate-dependent aminotransferase family protein [Tropicimonas isoalkanivorans]|uniref:Alanine-glyoxylate transaminase / serine-glyoxylate transaminase / serine-pyruvate transaminase n=1 Tax=Tropicimonas isoalkanivorans TaxID=441112 RepID=A0A1I1FX20_9RHOB|nr:aminotransferase class V-fold PLP-dependent enzyme [Tropicimonas isoalkanivorans]SFC03596.1 alanine-glyoxylate transaminase / serine-glyoxylate transaminase / serine-pyruvate transaminase [Tropicimonas isoalkanivorans]
MSVQRGTQYLAIPGPSVMPEAVLRAMHRPAPNIYTGELIDIVETIMPELKQVARTAGEAAIYICNGHGAWEAALVNVFSRGDRALMLATGRFGHGWADMAGQLGVEVERIDFGRRAPIDLDRVEAALRADTAHSLKAVMCVHVDTATSVRNDIRALREALDRAGHPALLMVDCIASLAVDPFEMDAWGVDVMVSGSQKGLMTPPGLGFVFFSPKADELRERAGLVTPYWDWRPRVRPEMFYQYFGGTAPTHHLYGLRAALDLIREEGMEAIWARHARLARAVWAAVEAWGEDGPLALNIADPACRSHAVTTVLAGRENGTRLRDWLSARMGVTLGIGLGMATNEDPNSDGAFRIGHMGYVNGQMVMGVLGSVDAGLKALDIPHGSGALEAASRALGDD